MDRQQASPAGSHKAGSVIDGRYEIIEPLGAGGMSVVYKARDLQIDRLIVLKFIRSELLHSQRSVDRFVREANLCSRLQHKGIIRVFSCAIADGHLYMAMEYLDGASLDKVLAAKAEGRLSTQEALPIFEQVCDALDYAHRLGILHRDLKPHNVMASKSGEVKLVDFGIGSFLGGSSADIQKLTQTGELIGSIAYMSPEQCRGEALDERSDIYSLGCLMYELLVGTPPFTGETPYAVLMKHLQERPKALTRLDGAWGGVVASMLEKDPCNRPQSAAAARELIGISSTRLKKRWPLPVSPITVALASILLIVCAWTAILESTPDAGAEQPPSDTFSNLMTDGKRAIYSYVSHAPRDDKVGKHALYCLTEACGVSPDRPRFRQACAYRSQILKELQRDDEAVTAARVVTESPPSQNVSDYEYCVALETLQAVAAHRHDLNGCVAICSRRLAYEQSVDPTGLAAGRLNYELAGFLMRINKRTEAMAHYERALQFRQDPVAKFVTLRELSYLHLSSIPALSSASARLREYEAAKKEVEVMLSLTLPDGMTGLRNEAKNELNRCNQKMKAERARS